MSPAYDDDPTITDDDELLRRIRPELIVPDQKSASGRRLSSAAFDDSSDGTPCSVNVRREALAPETILAQEKHGGYSVASVTAHVPRSLKQTVLHWPDDEEPGHAYIAGKKTTSVKRELARSAKWVAGPNWEATPGSG